MAGLEWMKPGISDAPASESCACGPAPVRARARSAHTSMPSSTTRSRGSSGAPPGRAQAARGETKSTAGGGDARGAGLLVDDRRQLAQEKLARGDGLGQAERQELRGRGRLGVLLRSDGLKLFEELFGAFEVEFRAQLAEGVDGEAEVFGGAFGLRGGGVCAAQEGVGAGGAVGGAGKL